MTEAEWLTSNDPAVMLAALAGASRRKLRLFGTACCRRIWPQLIDKQSRRLVESSERFADEEVTAAKLDRDFDHAGEAQEAVHWEGGSAAEQGGAEAVLGLRREPFFLQQVLEGTTEVAGSVAADAMWDQIYGPGGQGKSHPEKDREHDEAYRSGAKAEAGSQAALIRDIFGNPFRPVAADPGWRTSTVVTLARTIYDERAWDRLPVLADALEDAGCTNADLLGHLRDPALTHVRGCWAVDLLLGLS